MVSPMLVQLHWLMPPERMRLRSSKYGLVRPAHPITDHVGNNQLTEKSWKKYGFRPDIKVLHD
ncbi:MAG: hypothetical protein P4M11_13225 [Candidatus Pacebacteria bacterium]|nr:hypothetical protein [Candidatus Paceibacterota bacterium]